MKTCLSCRQNVPTNQDGLCYSCYMEIGDVPEMIAKVHDALEGRGELTGQDLFEIHSMLCALQPKSQNPK
jgi:hypothetical protein